MAQAIRILLPPLLALLAALVIFGGFLALQGVNPIDAYGLIWLGAFGTWFSCRTRWSARRRFC